MLRSQARFKFSFNRKSVSDDLLSSDLPLLFACERVCPLAKLYRRCTAIVGARKEYSFVQNDPHIGHGVLQCHTARRKQVGGDLFAIPSRQGSDTLPFWTACLWSNNQSDSHCDQQEAMVTPAAHAAATAQAAGSC